MFTRIVAAALVGAMGFGAASAAEPIVIDKGGKQLQVARERGAPRPKLVLHTTMATWCTACRNELPQFAYLRSVFKPEELAMYGLPYDAKDRPDQLKAWAVAHHPAYELMSDATQGEIASVKATVLANLRMDAVPASFITDSDGRILRSRWGPPSVSELRELMRSQKDEGKRR
jgi:peroxiredoxin